MPNTTTSFSETFTGVYDAYVDRIYRYHYYRTRHRETAEDLTSQTFLKAFEAFPRYDATKASHATWLYTIARHVLIDHLRVSRPSIDIEDAVDVLVSRDDIERDVVAREALAKVQGALRLLTPAQREVVLLRVWDGLAYSEIAAVTGKTEDACKMTFSRGVSTLRTHVGPTAILLLTLIHLLYS